MLNKIKLLAEVKKMVENLAEIELDPTELKPNDVVVKISDHALAELTERDAK